MKRKWTCEEANEWYSKLEWLRGCNFIGSDCANRLDMFQSYKAEEKLATAERELALCQRIGFNTVRLWANFDVYYAEPDSYMEIFDRYIDLCGKYGQKVMIVLGHEEDLPRGRGDDTRNDLGEGRLTASVGARNGHEAILDGQVDVP